jgi:hypothetical protein
MLNDLPRDVRTRSPPPALPPGVTLAVVGFPPSGEAPSSQYSRPSSSGSSTRITLTLKRRSKERNTYKVINSSSTRRKRARPNPPPTNNVDRAPLVISTGLSQPQSPGADGGPEEDDEGGEDGVEQGPTASMTRRAYGRDIGPHHLLDTAPCHVASTVATSILPDSGALVPATGSVDRPENRMLCWLQQQIPTRTLAAREKLRQMVAVGSQLAGHEVARQWKALIAQWRAEGICLSYGQAAGPITHDERDKSVRQRQWLVGESDCDYDFVALYDRLKRTTATTFLHAVLYRLQMSELGVRYAALTEETRASDARAPRTVAKQEMFRWLYGNENQSSADYNEFERGIKYWRKWREITQKCSRGVLALFPTSMAKSFVEQKLTINELHVWLRAICELSTHGMALARAVLPILEDAVAQKPPPSRRLRLEVWDGRQATLSALGSQWFEPDATIPLTPIGSQERDDSLSNGEEFFSDSSWLTPTELDL